MRYNVQYRLKCMISILSIHLFVSLHPVGRLSEDCEYFAYGLSSSGSDWVTVRFMKADDLTELPDVLERVKFSCLAWTHDAKGIFYNSYPRQDGKTDGQETTSRVTGTLSLICSVCKEVQMCVFDQRYGDHHQPQPEALLPRHRHQAVRGRPGCRVP